MEKKKNKQKGKQYKKTNNVKSSERHVNTSLLYSTPHVVARGTIRKIIRGVSRKRTARVPARGIYSLWVKLRRVIGNCYLHANAFFALGCVATRLFARSLARDR